VNKKFVNAMVSEVSVGEVKPTRENIVAEKYLWWYLAEATLKYVL